MSSLAVVAVAAIGLLYRFISSRQECTAYAVRDYDVYFQWDQGLKSLRLLDARSNSAEVDAKLHAAASKEATKIISQLMSGAQLKKAEGRFRLSVQGCGEPYLVNASNPEISELSQLMGAAISWDLQTIQELLVKGVNVNAREIGSGRTVLIWAAADAATGWSPRTLAKLSRKPDRRTVAFLLAHGADPNAQDVEGITALMRAGSPRAKLLLAAGADVNARDSSGRTALVHAIRRGDTETVKLLIDRHSDLNAKDKNGWTPLMYAANDGRPEEVKLLLASGADKTATNETGDTAMSIVRKKSRLSSDHKRVLAILSK